MTDVLHKLASVSHLKYSDNGQKLQVDLDEVTGAQDPGDADGFVFNDIAAHDLDDDWCGTGPTIPWEPPMPPDWAEVNDEFMIGTCPDMALVEDVFAL